MDATGLPRWSVFGTPGLTSFDPPDTVKAILFLAENDADGKNAKALAVICPKLFERGIKIGVAYPPAGLSDVNELIRERDDKTRLHGSVESGLKVVRDIIETAKLKARSKEDTAGAAPGSAPPVIDLPGLDGADDEKAFSMTPNGLFRGRMFVCGPFEVVAQSRIITDGMLRGVVIDKLNCAIYKRFRAANIEIPHSKHDVFVRMAPAEQAWLSKNGAVTTESAGV